MNLDLSVNDPTLTIMALKLGGFILGLVVVLTIVELYVPKILRGICRAAVGLGGIYLFAMWLS